MARFQTDRPVDAGSRHLPTRRSRSSGVARAACLCAALLILAACGNPADSSAPDSVGPRPAASTFKILGNVQIREGVDATGTLVFCAGTSYAAFADAGGNYAMAAVPPGSYTVIAQKEGCKTAPIQDLVLDPNSPTREVVLSGVVLWPLDDAGRTPRPDAVGGTLAGKATLSDRPSPEGVRIALEGTAHTATCDPAGDFALPGVPAGAYRAVFSLPGYQSQTLPVAIASGQVTRLPDRVTLLPADGAGDDGLSILGKVLMVGADGRVQTQAQAASVGIVENQLTAPAAADGAFQFKNLPAGNYTLIASAPGFRLSAPVEVQVADEPAVTVLVLQEDRAGERETGAVSGIVELEGAEPGRHGGTLVAIAGTSHTGVTGPDGKFTLSEVPPGSGVLVCSHPGYKPLEQPGLEVLAGETADAGSLTLLRDVEPPRVIASDPSDGEGGIVIRPEVVIRLTFNKRMRLETVKGALAIAPPCKYAVRRGNFNEADASEAKDALEVVLQGADRTVALKFRTRYTLTLGTEAADMEGLSLQKPFQLTFQTAGLRILGSYPADGAQDAIVNPASPIVLRFNGRVRDDGLRGSAIAISPAPAAMSSVRQIGRDPGTGWTVFALPVTLDFNTRYTLTCGSGVQAEDGTRVDDASARITFRTAPAPQLQSR